MAHENCHGRWERSKLGGVMEGSGFFVIRPHTGEVITGTHEGRGNSPIVGKCDGTTMSFCMANPDNGEVICYIKGRITSGGGKFFINGKFFRPLGDGEAVVVADSIVIEEGKRVLLAPDDWTAERPT